jgi:ABC transporter with metal-binding/Fe-S-binding domain ATP-binding protein
MFHYPNVKWTRLQAEALELPLIICETKGEKEDELIDLEQCLSDMKEMINIEGVVSGAVASEYQKTRIDRICQNLDLASFSPLWRKNAELVIRHEVNLGFEIVVSACMARGFTVEWLGRRIDPQTLEELKKISAKYGFHMAFEGGEAETFVLDGPIFRKKIVIKDSEKVWHDDAGYLRINDLQLKTKSLDSSVPNGTTT